MSKSSCARGWFSNRKTFLLKWMTLAMLRPMVNGLVCRCLGPILLPLDHKPTSVTHGDDIGTAN